MNQSYELTYLISPELDEKAVAELSQKLEMEVKEISESVKSEVPKKIRLAYPIKKKQEAFLATLEFLTQPEKIEELKGKIEKDAGIIRFLLVKKRLVAERKAKKTSRPKKEGELPLKKKVALEEIEKDLEKILNE